MRIGRLVVVFAVLLAVAAPVAVAFGFDDGVKPPRGIVGLPYSFKFKGRNGCPPYTFSLKAAALPPGLSLDSEGTIAGTPTTVGSYRFWVELHDSAVTCPPNGSFASQRPFTINIVTPLALTAPALTVAENGVRLTPTTLHAMGGKSPYTWAVTRAPDWLTLSPSGAISGTPDTPGSFRLEFTVTDQDGDTATVSAPLTVKAKLAVVTTRLSAVRVGRSYRALLRTNGGVGHVRWKVTAGRFPVGIRLDVRTGVVTGVPRKAGRYALTFTVTDSLGKRSEKQLALTVATAEKTRHA
jgi:large repetitive protein